MTTRVAWAAAALLLCGSAASAQTQDDRRVGLTMGYPTAVGVLWHVNDRLAIRPELDVSRIHLRSETTSALVPLASNNESTASSVRPGISALVYVARTDDLRMYVSPRYTYSFTDNSQNEVSETSTWLLSGSFGAQHQLGSRFGVYGELGIEYSRSTTQISDDFLSGTTRRSTIGTRSGVGVVLYF